MPFPSIPDMGAEKGKNILNTVLFHFAVLPMHLPQKSLTFPTIHCLPNCLDPLKWEFWPLVPGTAIPAGATAGKGDPSGLPLPGENIPMQGSSAFSKFCPGTRVGTFSSSVICFVPIQSPPLHIDTSAHFNICTFYVAKRAFPLKNVSLESDLYDYSDTFKYNFVPLLWLRKKRCFSLFDS